MAGDARTIVRMTPSQPIGFVPAHRGFFSTALAAQMRRATIDAMQAAGMQVVVPDESQTRAGCVESYDEAILCGRMFRERGVRGIVIGAVNFGDEQAAALAVREADLNVPILVFGCPEEEVLTPLTARRDSFCGLLSIGEALRQIGAKYSVPRMPICFPTEPAFSDELLQFAAACRVVHGLRRARYGQVGARPDAFWTCRFSEKSLQRIGVTTVTLDLSEVIGRANRLRADVPDVQATLQSIREYADVSGVPESALLNMARLELVLAEFVRERRLDALAVQCWTSIQEHFGVCTCTAMSRLGDRLVPCACEADILGTMSMHACLLASGTAATLADWNNLHNEDADLVNLWHCGVFPKQLARTPVKMGVQEIIAGATGRENAYGVVEFEAAAGPITLCRVTQDPAGPWKALVCEGAVEVNRAKTFGAYGWCRIPGLMRLYRDVLLRHFPHHVALTRGSVAAPLREAFGNYLGFETYGEAHAG